MPGRQIHIQNQCLFQLKQNAAPPWWKWSRYSTWQQITLGNDAILGCWSLSLTDWALSGGYSQVSLGEWKSMLMIRCITSIPATVALFMNPLGDDRVAGERCRLGSSYPLEYKILLCWGHSLVSIHMGHKYLHVFLPIQGVLSTYLFPNFLVINFPIMFFPKKKVHNQVHYSRVCPLGGFAFTTILQGHPRKGLWCCSCLLSGGACIFCRRPDPSLFLSADCRTPQKETGIG